jgi:Tfp pilus assembly protein PilN
MLRTNLSTRPFYNERAVHLILGVVAFLVFALTVFTVFQMVSLSRRNTEFSSQVNRDRSEAERLVRDATRIRRGIDQNELQIVVAAAREANSLIDQRTFSWTEFFNRIENTLPSDVMLTGVQPSPSNDGMKVSMTVVGRHTVDINEFMAKLEATGAFRSVLDRQQDELDNGLARVVIDALYVPAAAEGEKLPGPARSANGGSR